MTNNNYQESVPVIEKGLAVANNMLSLSTKAKRRMRTSREETEILEEYYRSNPNPNHEQKREVAEKVKMGVKNVHFWFQNRRAKENKKKKLFQQRQQLSTKDSVTSSPQQVIQKQNHDIENYITGITFRNSYVSQKASSIPSVYHYHSTTGKQQQISRKGKETVKLPPISYIMIPEAKFQIPFYFHHSSFGIEDCMLQLMETQAYSNNHFSLIESPFLGKTMANGAPASLSTDY